MKKISKAEDDLENKVNQIYTNLLTIMGIFVAIFSLIMVNFSNITRETMTKEFLIPMNISLCLVISAFVGLLLIFINKAKSKIFLAIYIAIMIVLVALLCIFI